MSAMTDHELDIMYKGVPKDLFRVHDWRNDVVTVGTVPGNLYRRSLTGHLIIPGRHSSTSWFSMEAMILFLSVGQVVPHEVIGMANYNKNLFVGTGGPEGINKSHFIGAVYGMERIMGKASNPVRSLLNYASENFITHLPVVYVHTVIGRDDNRKAGNQRIIYRR